MNKNDCIKLIDSLSENHSLKSEEFLFLLNNIDTVTMKYASCKAEQRRREIYGTDVYIRGLTEISNICKNDCLYCGIRRSNTSCKRYRLTKDDILSCCDRGYQTGFRTFVFQGGEDPHYTDKILTDIIYSVKTKYPDCAVTLSLGERSRNSYKALFDAGADRYLLRHETADSNHYSKLHPSEMSWQRRMMCLNDLRDIGYQVGCGFMVGSPYQTNENLVKDLMFIQKFSPDMCGIGPFIPHHATPFSDFRSGSVKMTLFLLSVIRLIKPNILLPATTALGTLAEDGQICGIKAGANVIMPNLSPKNIRKQYELYDNKSTEGAEASENLDLLKSKMNSIGYNIVTSRGDIILNDKGITPKQTNLL